jgi:hypothetical protein
MVDTAGLPPINLLLNIFLITYKILFLETGSHYVDQAILKIIITQPQAPDLLGLQKLVIWLK